MHAENVRQTQYEPVKDEASKETIETWLDTSRRQVPGQVFCASAYSKVMRRYTNIPRGKMQDTDSENLSAGAIQRGRLTLPVWKPHLSGTMPYCLQGTTMQVYTKPRKQAQTASICVYKRAAGLYSHSRYHDSLPSAIPQMVSFRKISTMVSILS